MNIPSPPDRDYDEHRARAVLADLIGASLVGIQVFTLDELATTSDGRIIEADLAIELHLEQRGARSVALFAWAVNFGVEQICIWTEPLSVVWPQHADSPRYDVRTTWHGWPGGSLVVADGSKLRPSETGLNAVDLRFERGGFRIETNALEGDEVVPDPTTLLLVPLG